MFKIPNTLINFTDYRAILCLDGTLPEVDFFQCGLPVIAADGSANALMKMGIKPSVVIGDLDGILPSLLNQVETVYRFDQNFCDFEKTLDYLNEKNLLPCIIAGISGGQLDHILNNVNIFTQSNNVFYAPPLCGMTLKSGDEKMFELPVNTKISILGIPFVEVTTLGLQWDLSRGKLSFPGSTSCFNRSVEKKIQIKAHEGCALVMIHCSLSL